MTASKTNIDLYTAGTPNGQKLSILLEELGLNYIAHKIDLTKAEQKEAWYLQINPNGRIPALVDNTPSPPQRVFEGGAMILYLCARYDPDHTLSFPADSPAHWEAVCWLTWMQSGIGPLQGQANHFVRYAPTKIDYAIRRYQTEVRRLYEVLETQLVAQEAAGAGLWVVGGKYSFVDVACFSWVNWAEWAGVETKGYSAIEKWLRVISERPAVKKGLDVPEKFELKETMKSKEKEQDFATMHGNWVMKGQEEDQARHK